MEQVKRIILEHRAHTDASLYAERAATDSGEYWAAATAQQVLDDLIERDRILADARLVKFRDSTDSLLAHHRSASPSRNGDGVTQERRIVDRGKKTEREDMDARLRHERQRSDLALETERKDQELHHSRLEVRRQDTNDQLSSERHDSDTAIIALGHTREALAVSEDQQGHFEDILGMVTHDLRSPLTVIAMNAEAIAHNTQDFSIQKSAHHVTRAAARMERLLADLLDVARIQAGTLRITRRVQRVDELLSEVLKTYGPLFADRGLMFTIDPPPAGSVASLDYDRIVQVLSNLLGNAMKFTLHGGAVTLRVQQRARSVEFSLSDNGPGICPGDLPHIFERFWQLENHARRGLGLGLYICKKIVEAHDGAIMAESELGKGTTLRFTLPVSCKSLD
jgi:signal transduction histidine kinase